MDGRKMGDIRAASKRDLRDTHRLTMTRVVEIQFRNCGTLMDAGV
jgi:hypothetical protein